jgi:hypothetical protein
MIKKKTRFVWSFLFVVLAAACNKKESATTVERTANAASNLMSSDCAKEIVTDKPVMAGETGIVIPAGAKLCLTKDNSTVRVELPKGYAFITAGENKTLPVYATYTCICSATSLGSHCLVFYADGMGFGCLQSSCSGSCTGKFTYGGYSIDKIVSTADRDKFFSLPEVQDLILKNCADDTTNADWIKESVYGVPFYFVRNEKLFLAIASCNCDGTQACKLKMLGLKSPGSDTNVKIYFCDGGCNGCELTVN